MSTVQSSVCPCLDAHCNSQICFLWCMRPSFSIFHWSLRPRYRALSSLPLAYRMSTRPLDFYAGPMVWIDCEMTGLDPRKDKILEVAVRGLLVFWQCIWPTIIFFRFSLRTETSTLLTMGFNTPSRPKRVSWTGMSLIMPETRLSLHLTDKEWINGAPPNTARYSWPFSLRALTVDINLSTVRSYKGLLRIHTHTRIRYFRNFEIHKKVDASAQERCSGWQLSPCRPCLSGGRNAGGH